MNLGEPICNCNYIAVSYDYNQFILTNLILSLALFFNKFLISKYYSEVKYDIDSILKLILVVYNTSFFLLQILIVPLQSYFISMGWY